MIKLIIGSKGTGKTKELIDLVNQSGKNAKGNVVCIEKHNKLTFDVTHKVRLIDVNDYDFIGFDAFYGFIAGLLAGDYDISDIYVDSILRIGSRDYSELSKFLEKLDKITKNINVFITVSSNETDLPNEIEKYK